MGVKKKFYIIVLLIFSIISIIYMWPIFQNINNMGVLDWDTMSLYYEVIRSSIVNFHQIPLWNPYGCGGDFLFANPESPVISLNLILVLLFGTMAGIKIGILLHLIIGLFGMFLLSRYLRLGILSSFLVAFIFLLSSQYALQLGIGNNGHVGIVFLPYIFLFYLKSFKDIKFVILTVLFLILMFFTAAIYEFIMVVLFLFIYSLFKLLLQKNTKVIKIFMLIIILTFLLCAIKFLPILDVIKENPIKAEIYSEGNDVKTFFIALLSRNQGEIHRNDLYNAYTTPIEKRPLPPWHDYGMYIGVIPLILIILGLFSKFKERWILISTSIISLIFYFGEASPINLWGLLHSLPILDSLRNISRFHHIFIFAFSILAGMGLSSLELNKNKKLKIVVLCIVLIVLFDLILVNSPIFKDIFINKLEISEEKSDFRQIINNYSYNNYSESATYIAYLRNEGTLNCHQTFYIASAVSAIDFKSKLYKGEYYLKDENGNVSLIYFSPNKIKLHLNVSEDDLLVINQNYHKGWKIKGKEAKPYYGLISTEVEKGEYYLTFYYLPNIFLIGSLITILTVILLIYLYRSPANLNYKLILILVLLIILLILFIYLQTPKLENEMYKNLTRTRDYSLVDIPHLFKKDITSFIYKQPVLYFLRQIWKNNGDIINTNLEASRSVLNYYKIEWIILHKQFFRYNLLFNQEYEYNPYWAREKDFYQEQKNLIENNLNISPYYEDEDITVYKIEDYKPFIFILLGEGWHKVEYYSEIPTRWVEDEALLKIVSPKKTKIKLSFDALNFYEPKELRIYFNNNLIKNHQVNGLAKITINLDINQGENILKLYTNRCLKPSKVSISADTRCLSLNIRELEYKLIY